MCAVRELTPGERPRDWVESANDDASSESDGGAGSQAMDPGAPAPASPARVDAGAPGSLAPERYKVQFTGTEEYVRLVDGAKALLSRAVGRATLEETHLRAMRALVSELTEKKYASNDAARRRVASNAPKNPQEARSESTDSLGACVVPPHPRQRGRHIPAAVRRAVLERDSHRCAYVAVTGERCAETHRLEFHHLSAMRRDEWRLRPPRVTHAKCGAEPVKPLP
jgi:hypothetical protein